MFGRPKNLTESLFPLFSMYALIGHGVFRYPADKPRLAFSVIWALVSTSLYLVALGFTLDFIFNEPWYGDDERVVFVIIYVNVGIAIVGVILSWCNAKKIELIVQGLTKVDETLQELGTTFNYARDRNVGYGLILVWTVMIIVFNWVDSLWFHNMMSISRNYSIVSIIHHPVHINTIVSFNFCMSVRHVHLELRRIGKRLDDAYGKQMAFEISALFVMFTGLLYELYIMSINQFGNSRNNRIIVIGTWISVYFAKLILINEACEGACSEAQRTGEILHCLDKNIEDSELPDEINQFCLQLMHDPVAFSPAGLVTLGHKFVKNFLGTVTTYLVILIQMTPSKSEISDF